MLMLLFIPLMELVEPMLHVGWLLHLSRPFFSYVLSVFIIKCCLVLIVDVPFLFLVKRTTVFLCVSLLFLRGFLFLVDFLLPFCFVVMAFRHVIGVLTDQVEDVTTDCDAFV